MSETATFTPYIPKVPARVLRKREQAARQLRSLEAIIDSLRADADCPGFMLETLARDIEDLAGSTGHGHHAVGG